MSAGKGIVWAESARNQLRRIDRETAMRIFEALTILIRSGEGDVLKLTDIHPPEYRPRVGDDRVRFHDHGERIEILSVRHRRDAYRSS